MLSACQAVVQFEDRIVTASKEIGTSLKIPLLKLWYEVIVSIFTPYNYFKQTEQEEIATASTLHLCVNVCTAPLNRLPIVWTQYKCSERSACHTRGARIGICARTWVGLPLFADKEEPHNSSLFTDGQSIDGWDIIYDYIVFIILLLLPFPGFDTFHDIFTKWTLPSINRRRQASLDMGAKTW